MFINILKILQKLNEQPWQLNLDSTHLYWSIFPLYFENMIFKMFEIVLPNLFFTDQVRQV